MIIECLLLLGLFIGAVVHNEEVPPNKRGFLSNQSGIMLVVVSFVAWIFCTIVMPLMVVFMLGGVIAEDYICSPYRHDRLDFVDEVRRSRATSDFVG
ncbi:unnamed protein product [Ixodes persulcatus]